MSVNHVLLETIELTQSAASVTFDNIPQTGYSGLKIVYSARNTSNNSVVYFTCNGTASNRSGTVLFGSGSATGSLSGGDGDARIGLTTQNDYTSNVFSNGEIYIPNYTSSNHKSISADAVQENNGSTSYAYLTANLWASTSSINSFTLTPISGSFAQYSTFSLYGIAATGTSPSVGPKAQGGNIVANDGTYWYHAFLASGTFTPTVALTCDYLVVAGGGGGGYDSAGGGGAGGFRATTSQSLTSTNYLVTVGAGGAGSTNYGVNTNGSNSSFNSFTSAGGGQGGNGGEAGQNGGSGGGATGGGNYTLIGSGNTPSTSPSQGNNGGQGIVGTSGNRPSGGGGGASQVGFNGAGSTAGNGGAGTNTYSTWATATSTGVSGYYAGGGGGSVGVSGTAGGSGGAGGGGNGGKSGSTSPTAGVANTGGGGGAGSTNTGAAGGSGIVIIRYAMA